MQWVSDTDHLHITSSLLLCDLSKCIGALNLTLVCCALLMPFHP